MKSIFFLFCFISSLSAQITFFIATDSHYGKKQWSENEEQNKQAIYDMNQLIHHTYPGIDSDIVQTPKGVILTGDLTDMGSYLQWRGLEIFRFLQWDGFISDYGLNGESLLNFPVFEGYGNHDTLAWGDSVKSSIKKRNTLRDEILYVSENGLHYSWNWDGVHFVQLNIYPGDTKEAENSLSFLKEDLENHILNRNIPIILFHHYGFDGYSDNWWSNEERQDYYDVIKDYNVVAIFQGHQHGMFHIVWRGIDVFSSGGVFANEYLVCNIKDNKLKVYPRKQGNWGDWHFEKEIKKN